ncbi:MAG TPA: ferritin-like domain-containing protein [Solirubrobacteraceae bacterium]|nr:ferritin-like domain-containing protein [Solirubrobacteraceae bacterium]
MEHDQIAAFGADDVAVIDNVLADTSVPGITRRGIVKRAALGAVAASALGPVASAMAKSDSAATIINTAITAEALAVTYLTGLIENASATGVTKFVDVLKAANAAEYDHYKVLKSLGAKPLTTKFWAPDDFFKPGHVFPTIEVAETLFVNAYLIGTTTFAKAGKADLARYTGEILGVEAEHRALARFAQGKLPNNLAFESYELHSMGAIVKALEGAGVGFGAKGSKPGKFYEFKKPPQSALTHISNPAPK